jgi:hypothetical protein
MVRRRALGEVERRLPLRARGFAAHDAGERGPKHTRNVRRNVTQQTFVRAGTFQPASDGPGIRVRAPRGWICRCR